MIKNIILDFGHGGINDAGVYTTRGKKHTFPNGETAYEGVINRQIGGLVQSYLRVYGQDLNVVTPVGPDDSRDLSLGYRVRLANQFNPRQTIFISIHCNAFNSRARGFEIFTTRGVTKSDALAENIADRIEPFYNKLELKLRYDFSDGDKDKERDFYVLRKTRCPAVLLECLFFDNREDFEMLKSVEFQKELSWRIYQGIVDYIEQNK